MQDLSSLVRNLVLKLSAPQPLASPNATGPPSTLTPSGTTSYPTDSSLPMAALGEGSKH